MNIGNKIMELRKKNNLSQEELSEKIGVTRQTISKWELGETFPNIKQSNDLSKIFNVNLNELINDDLSDILIEKTTNTERLAGLTLHILKVLAIFIIGFILITVVLLIGFRFNRKSMNELADKAISITCTLHNEKYSYRFDFNEESGKIVFAGGDGYLANITDIEKYSDAYQALDVIDAYVKNNGGSCTRSDD